MATKGTNVVEQGACTFPQDVIHMVRYSKGEFVSLANVESATIPIYRIRNVA